MKSPIRTEQSFLLVVAGLLIASGLVHCCVWLLDGGSLAGSVSWRKPILFGFSAGLTVASIGWLVGKMPPRRGDGMLLGVFGAAMLVEVALITMQQWRGVPSHFNRSTLLDAAILIWIERLILIATLILAEMTRRSFGTLSVERDMALAIRSGMLFLLFACLLGFGMAFYGEWRVSHGLKPEIFGAAGVMKFPHGMPIHAIQFLPFAAWLLRRLGVAAESRYRTVASAAGAMAAFTLFSLLQTFSGRARFDLSVVSAAVLILAVLLFVAPPCVLAARWMWTRNAV